MSDPHSKPRHFRPPTHTLSQSITTLITSHFGTAHKNQVYFDPHIKSKSIRSPHKNKSISIPGTKAKLISNQTLMSSQCFLHSKNKSVSIPPNKKNNFISTQTLNQVIFDPHTKPSQFRSHHWNQVNFDPHSNMKSISMPRHKNRVNFDPDTNQDIFRQAHKN